LTFPCVVKPVALSGSRGVIRADDPASFARAVVRLRALLRSPEIRAERDEAHRTAVVDE
jgi:biotin carboxylase